MLGYKINKEDAKLIEKVNFLKCEFTDSVCNIYINASMTYGADQYYLVGRVYKDYKAQGNYTYINGIEKEYKGVKPVLNAIMKKYNTSLEYDKILIFAGLKKDIKETRSYKKLIKEYVTQQTENNENKIAACDHNNDSIKVSNETVEISEVKTSDLAITDSTDQTEILENEASKVTITDGYTTLKQAEGIQIIGKIESHTSYISNETYDMATDIKILKNSNLIYEAYRVDFPLNCKDKISLVSYLDDIILYINNSTLEPYWLNIQLNKLFKDKNTIRFNIAVKEVKNKILKEDRIKESQQREKELQELKTNVIELANSKNILVAIGSENIRLLKDLQQKQNSKDFINMILEMDIADNLLKPHLIKNFNATDTIGLRYDEIIKKLLLKTKEYLSAV